LEYLKSKQKEKIIKVSSDFDDKILQDNNSFYVGLGVVRTIFFNYLNSFSIILTLPDLDTFHLKKSIHPVHYYYVFHSMFSTHRAYRHKAFDAYDTILCACNHQIKEIRKNEKNYKLKKKNLIKFGYPKLDLLIEKVNEHKIYPLKNKKNIVLITPTWGKSSMSFKTIELLIKSLLKNEFFIILRFHPMTLNNNLYSVNKIINKFKNNKDFIFDDKLDSLESFVKASMLITDWSASAIEFSFSKLCPVILIDTTPKINNHLWKDLNLPCFEDEVMSKIGYIIPLNDLEKIPLLIKQMTNKKIVLREKIIDIRDKNVFNVSKSIKIGTEEFYNHFKKIK